jgi:malate dehydrogenase (oxaloacetate-decarboxylating)
VVDDDDSLDPHKCELAWPSALASSKGLHRDSSLEEAVEAIQPTVLIGTTGQAGIFGEEVVRTVARHADNPLIMALSNPTSKTEALPADVFDWTDGRAYMATGSPFDPVEYNGHTLGVSQGNNVYVFPGVGLGAIISEATEVSDGMFAAAAHALADRVDTETLEAGMLYPPLAELRDISRSIAAAVAVEARDSGLGLDLTDAEIAQRLDHEIWDLDYPTMRPA